MTTPTLDSFTKATNAIAVIRKEADKLQHAGLVAGDAWLVDQASRTREAAAGLARNISEALAAQSPLPTA